MHDGPTEDPVARQYGRWRYPFPIEDLDGWLSGNWEWFDPSHAHRVLWPDREYTEGLDILIAGCGTNQAAVFAYTNPTANVCAIDVSQASLDHQQHLKDKYGLSNLLLQRLPIEASPELGLEFDLVVSTGVLHHLSDPVRGLAALKACARRDAAIGVMVYAEYGRLGVEILASVFRDLGLQQDDESVAVITETLSQLPSNHPVQSYLALANDLGSDAGLVDTFLHARERSYTVDDCMSLVDSAGLTFQSWFLNAPYYLHDISGSREPLASKLAALSEVERWSVMERVHPSNACHFFLACLPERERSSYAIDFSTESSLDYVPHFRKGCGLAGAELFRPGWRMNLNPAQLTPVQLVDGHRSIRDISSLVERRSRYEPGFARGLFRALWQLDFFAMTIPAGLTR